MHLRILPPSLSLADTFGASEKEMTLIEKDIIF